MKILVVGDHTHESKCVVAGLIAYLLGEVGINVRVNPGTGDSSTVAVNMDAEKALRIVKTFRIEEVGVVDIPSPHIPPDARPASKVETEVQFLERAANVQNRLAREASRCLSYSLEGEGAGIISRLLGMVGYGDAAPKCGPSSVEGVPSLALYEAYIRKLIRSEIGRMREEEAHG